jgi:hypothetical protein
VHCPAVLPILPFQCSSTVLKGCSVALNSHTKWLPTAHKLKGSCVLGLCLQVTRMATRHTPCGNNSGYTLLHLQTANTCFFLHTLQSQLSETMTNVTTVYVTDRENNDAHHNLSLFIVYMGDLFTTRFIPKGPSSDSTHIESTKNYWVMSGLYKYDLIFTINQFILKDNLGCA